MLLTPKLFGVETACNVKHQWQARLSYSLHSIASVAYARRRVGHAERDLLGHAARTVADMCPEYSSPTPQTGMHSMPYDDCGFIDEAQVAEL